jgi:hypothetical protein
MKKVVCPNCGREVYANCIKRHVRACQNRPSDEELERLYDDGVPYIRMSEKYSVGMTTIHAWLNDAGLLDRPRMMRKKRTCRTPDGYAFVVDHVLLLADPLPELAPLWGTGGGCVNCGHEAECRRRIDQLDLWPLCQTPTRRDVALAYVDGRIGFDGKLPEWLPEMVQELTRA